MGDCEAVIGLDGRKEERPRVSDNMKTNKKEKKTETETKQKQQKNRKPKPKTNT